MGCTVPASAMATVPTPADLAAQRGCPGPRGADRATIDDPRRDQVPPVGRVERLLGHRSLTLPSRGARFKVWDNAASILTVR